MWSICWFICIRIPLNYWISITLIAIITSIKYWLKDRWWEDVSINWWIIIIIYVHHVIDTKLDSIFDTTMV